MSFSIKLINCQQCDKRIMVRPADLERGSITCTHVGCGALNSLRRTFQYSDALVPGLPAYGRLTYLDNPGVSYPLQFGQNVIGTGHSATVRVDRFSHNGRCFISRRHCTLTVTFDPWRGQLRYQLQDGAPGDRNDMQYSLNGTALNGAPLQKVDLIDVEPDGIITLGGVDRFRLTHFIIPPAMLETYRIELDYNPDRTE